MCTVDASSLKRPKGKLEYCEKKCYSDVGDVTFLGKRRIAVKKALGAGILQWPHANLIVTSAHIRHHIGLVIMTKRKLNTFSHRVYRRKCTFTKYVLVDACCRPLRCRLHCVSSTCYPQWHLLAGQPSEKALLTIVL
uniref:Uncharacterized protein n=1 Tax=Rhipicephalus microplus TaxID=6941 RepID=A0A6G5AHT3_RHIMP